MKNVSELCVLSSKEDKWSCAMHRNRFICSHYSLYDLTPLICLKIRARKVKNYRVSILIEYCSRAKLDFICPATLKTAKTVLNALWKLKHNLLKSLTTVGCARSTFLWPPRWTLLKKVLFVLHVKLKWGFGLKIKKKHVGYARVQGVW